MLLYHATFKARIKSIKKLGLGTKQIKTWDISEKGKVQFAKDPYVAESYCEAAEDVEESIYNSGIVILCVESSCLDSRLLGIDNNVRNGSTITYAGIVDSCLLSVWDEKQIILLMMAKRIIGRG